MLFYSKLHEKINCVEIVLARMLNIPPCQSENISSWVEVASNFFITLYILDFCCSFTVYIRCNQCATGWWLTGLHPQAKSLIKLGPQMQNKRVFGIDL